MNKVKLAQAFFSADDVIVATENTLQPHVVGVRRKLTTVGKTYFRGQLLDAVMRDGKVRLAAGSVFSGPIPTRARDVLAVTDDEVRFRLAPDQPGEHTVTYRKLNERGEDDV